MSQVSTARRAAAGAFAFAGADFWRLWYAGLIIFLVRWVETLAIAVFVYQHTRSPFFVAMMTMLRLLPMGLFGAFLGAAAERIERRSALVAVVVMMGATSGTLALLAWGGKLAVWQLALASFINGLGWATDNPVRRVAIGEVVGSEHMGTAMSFDVAANNASRMLGPTIGGLLLAGAGIQGVFSLSVALYLTALAAALSVRYRNVHLTVGGQAVFARIAEGFALVRQDKRLLGTLTITVIYNVFAWPFTSMVPVIAQAHLHLDTAATGVLASMDGAGAFFGAIAIALLVRRRHYARAYVTGVSSYTLMLIVFALMPSPLIAGAALLMTGIGGAGFSIMQATLVYLFAPPEMRSRLLGVLSVCIGIGPLGFVHIGLLADWIGAQGAVVATGFEGLLALALTWRLWRRIGEA